VAALLPVLIGGLCVASATALVGVVAYGFEVAIFALNVCAFLGLGLSIDYALLLVQRFREELALGRPPRDAVIVTMDTAGRAVWVSGMTVAVSLLVLMWVPVPLLRSVALGGVLAVTTALLGALVLLPALLAWLGPRVNRLAVARTDVAGPSPFWRRVGALSMRHPITTAFLCSAALLTLASPVLRLRSAVPDARMFGRESEVRRVETHRRLACSTRRGLPSEPARDGRHARALPPCAYLAGWPRRRASPRCARRCSSSTRPHAAPGARPRAGLAPLARSVRRPRAGDRGGRLSGRSGRRRTVEAVRAFRTQARRGSAEPRAARRRARCATWSAGTPSSPRSARCSSR
jgi:hypothetical protein